MSYRRRGYKKRGPIKKKPTGVWPAIQKVGGLAIKALSMLNSEKKHVDVTRANAVVTSAGSMTLLNGLTQGTTDVTRVGDDVKFTSSFLRMGIQHNSAVTSGEFLRFILFRDNQSNGAAPSGNDLLVTSSDPFSPLNLDYSRRFKILKDKIYCTSDSGSNEAQYLKFFLDFSKVKPSHSSKVNIHKTDYGLGNAGTVADISTGAYYIWLCSNEAVNGPFVRFTNRLRYVDN